jgi:mRNA interferase MazF
MAAEGAPRNLSPGGVTAAGPSRIRTVFRYRHHQKQFFNSSTSIPRSSQQAQRDRYPLTMELKGPGLPKKSWVKISQIQTLSVKRIGKRIARSSEEELALVIDGFNEIVGG